VPISEKTRQIIRQRAKYLCEYCHSPERSSSNVFTIDHLMPQSLGGSDDLSNLALACRRCNERRYNFMSGTDPEVQQEVALFNPRLQSWADHFIWSADGLTVVGITSVGRATCHRLDMNDDFHNQKFIQESRQLWIEGGWHPPADDPRRQ
jgi:hypothetical protein